MKKLFFLLAFMAYLFAWANPIDENVARQLALNFIAAQGKSSPKIAKFDVLTQKGNALMYIYEFENGGFVIVSADDQVEPVLGFDTQNPLYRKNGTINPELQYWLETYSAQIAYIIENNAKSSEANALWQKYLKGEFPTGSKNDVNPLLTTKWDQEYPYNYYTPSNTPVGCVATATGQIMKYWNWPDQGVDKHTLFHPTYGALTADFGNTQYNFAAMPNQGDNSNHDVARLLYHLGIAFDMNYNPDGSGSQIYYAVYVLPNYFKYSHLIRNVVKEEYTDNDWISLMASELQAGRPILYAGSSEASGGHAFVMHGYRVSDNKFYFNWGWSGSGDGWYALTSLNPLGNDFTQNQHAVINIKPEQTAPKFYAVKNWSKLNQVGTNQYPYIIQMHAVNENVAWGIGADGSGNNANYRIYTKTTDGGYTWTPKAVTNLGGTAFSQIFALSDQVAYIAMWGNDQANNKILKTTDGGNTWSVVLTGGHAASFFNVVHFFNQNDGFVMGDPDSEFELYTTTDGGQNWTRVPGENIPDPITGEYGIVFHYDAVGDTIWFTTNKGRIYKSTDKGYNWIVDTIALGDCNIEIAFADDGQRGMAVYYNTNTKVYSVYKTLDGGRNWEIVSIDTAIHKFYSLDYVPGSNGKFIFVGRGIFVCEDMQTFAKLTDYYSDFVYLSVASVGENKTYIGTWAYTFYDGAWICHNLEPQIIPDFSVSTDITCVNSQVTFTNKSTGAINSYSWNFGEGANPQTAEGPGPHVVTYSTGGLKTVSLTVNGNITVTKPNILKVDEQAPIPVESIFGCDTVARGAVRRYIAKPFSPSCVYIWRTSSGVMTIQTYLNDTVWVKMPNFNGNYNLYVKATNGCGETPEKSKLIKVQSSATCNETILGLNEISPTFAIGPNPANDFVNVTANEPIVYYEILDINGRTLDAGAPNCHSIKLDLSGLAKGVYMIKVSTPKSEYSDKIVVQ